MLVLAEPGPGAAIPFGFAPDAERARLIDRRMLSELGRSLEHVFAASAGTLRFDADRAGLVCAALAGGAPHGPGVFGRYYEAVRAALDGDAATAEALLAELCLARPCPEILEIVALGDPALGPDTARYVRMMDSDPLMTLGFMPPAPDVAEAFRLRLADGLSLLDRALPELAGEVRAIVRQIVIAGGDLDRAMQFDGGSHYQLWGALFLNGTFHPDRVAVLEVLAHESAHSLLFGFCVDEALVENGDDELYASPLRSDRRPMDGIYHATFVSARMHWAMTRLAGTGAVTPEERERALAAAAADRANFQAGHAVVRAHGRLTGTGRALMRGAAEYMDAAA